LGKLNIVLPAIAHCLKPHVEAGYCHNTTSDNKTNHDPCFKVRNASHCVKPRPFLTLSSFSQMTPAHVTSPGNMCCWWFTNDRGRVRVGPTRLYRYPSKRELAMRLSSTTISLPYLSMKGATEKSPSVGEGSVLSISDISFHRHCRILSQIWKGDRAKKSQALPQALPQDIRNGHRTSCLFGP
jgi:hypothetical protein